MLVCKCARGRIYKCPGMMMGAPLQPGYDSHEDPSGAEWVFYSSAAILPIAVIHISREIYASRSAATTYTKTTIKGRAAADYRSSLDAKANRGVHLSNKDRKALNRAKNVQVQEAKKGKK